MELGGGSYPEPKEEPLAEEFEERKKTFGRCVEALDHAYDLLAMADTFDEHGDILNQIEDARDNVSVATTETLGDYKNKR